MGRIDSDLFMLALVLTGTVCLGLQALSSKLFVSSVVVSNRRKIDTTCMN